MRSLLFAPTFCPSFSVSKPQAKIALNGVVVGGEEEKTLQHLDRLKLGSNNLFVFVGFPAQRDAKNDETKFAEFDYDFLQSELARGSELLFQR